MMRYSREETIKDFDKASKDIKRLYKEGCINRKGKTNDTDDYYTEIFSERLLHMKVGEENIGQIDRSNYKVGSHSKTVSKNNTNRRCEELICLKTEQLIQKRKRRCIKLCKSYQKNIR